VDLANLVYLIGFLNFHGLMSIHLNNYTRERVDMESYINKKFGEIIAGEEWNIRRNP
jgi:hypothetical protein